MNILFKRKLEDIAFFKYHDFTLEYYSNVETQEEGEYFHLKALYYIHGFLNETGDMNNAHSKANFIPIPLKDLDSVGATVILLKNNGDNTFSQFTKF